MTNTEVIAEVVAAAVRVATGALIAQCADLQVKVAALEARAPVPGPAGQKGDTGDRGETGPKGHDGMGTPGSAGRDGADGKDAPPVDIDAIVARAAALIQTPKDGRDGKDGVDGKDAQVVDLEDVAQRAAVLVPPAAAGRDGTDGRDGQPGVPGRDGKDGIGIVGEKGQDGAPGRDGTLEKLRVEQVDERSWRLVRSDDGALIDTLTFSVPLYRGVYVAGTSYVKGDSVTFGGSLWIAKEPTRDKPGDGVTGWQLAVKAGREGREGKPGKDGSSGPKGEKGDPGRNFS